MKAISPQAERTRSSSVGCDFEKCILGFCIMLIFFIGTYKPRVRCYDTYQLSLKFERCLDSEGKRLTELISSFLYSSVPLLFEMGVGV